MNDDELKKLWQQQPLRNPPTPQQLISAMQSRATLFRGVIDARDLRELWACGIVIVIFTIFYFTVYRSPLARLGDLIVIGGAVFIACRLVYTKRANPPAAPGSSVVESLRAELKAVRAQSGLLGSVLWWYLLPLTVGEIVATWGLGLGIAANIPFILFFLAVNGFIYWLNQLARRKQLLPLEAQLESLVRSAETGAPVEETHVVSLRPIVLSMAAAEMAKPVEFRVAFSQLAIYGVSGIVGVWFFLTLGRAIENGRPLIPETSGANLTAADAKRYTVAAQNIIDLFNAGDYSALEKLYSREMSKAFPPRDTSDFYARLAKDYGRIEKYDGPFGRPAPWVEFSLQGQRGELTMSLAVDANNKVTGIYFKPAQRSSPKLKLVVLEFLRGQNLAWGAAAFLVGLAYSWAIQKATERAVGISSLGIHLARGQNLILWDEIKEVRILRILNIRSLWLIRENGEKMITPWSSLEGHSELKTSVERFAPANHPIRKYLTLLTRI